MKRTIELTLPKVGPEIAEQLRALFSPTSLAIMAGVLVAWVASHAFAVGEIIDVIVAAVGVVSIGLAVFSGIDELFQFAKGVYEGRSDAELDRAAGHLARAIAILEVQAVLAVLFKDRPRTSRVPVGPEPPRNPGLRYEPRTQGVLTRGAGGGETSWWGDIEFSTRGSQADGNLGLFHEQVHQFLTPKLYPMRRFRVEMRAGSYTQSSLWRFTEEVLAETRAQVKIFGFDRLFSSLAFPVENGYVYWKKAGADPGLRGWVGRGLVPEGTALVAAGLAAGMHIQVWFKPGARTVRGGSR